MTQRHSRRRTKLYLKLKWYWSRVNQGGAVSVIVYMNGVLCGTLVFRADDFSEIRKRLLHVQFIKDNRAI